jgi:hypothetical protein
MGLSVPLSRSTVSAHRMCAKRCCDIHHCSDAAGIIHQPADFLRDAGRVRVARQASAA